MDKRRFLITRYKGQRMINKLSDFGYNFQVKLIAALMTDKNFLQQISDILDYKYFESEATSFIVRCIKAHVVEHKSPPTMEVMKVKIKECRKLSDGQKILMSIIKKNNV